MKRNADLSIDKLINRLIHLGAFTDEETIQALLQKKEEVRPALINLLYDKKVWDLKSDLATWAPICIIHLLSSMGNSKEAAEAVIDSIKKYHNDMGDWITEEASNVLAGFGSVAFENIGGMLFDRDMEEFCRSTGSNALFLISKESGNDFTKMSIELIKKAIMEEESNENDLMRTLLTSDLSDFKDPDSLDFIKSLFQRELIDAESISMEEITKIYNYEYEDLKHMSRRDPLEIFQKNANHYIHNCEYSRWTDKKLNPRNGLCPCGSGKKFKKCCMLLEK